MGHAARGSGGGQCSGPSATNAVVMGVASGCGYRVRDTTSAWVTLVAPRSGWSRPCVADSEGAQLPAPSKMSWANSAHVFVARWCVNSQRRWRHLPLRAEVTPSLTFYMIGRPLRVATFKNEFFQNYTHDYTWRRQLHATAVFNTVCSTLDHAIGHDRILFRCPKLRVVGKAPWSQWQCGTSIPFAHAAS